MVHKLVKYIQSFTSESLFNTYFYGLRGRQTQGRPRAVHTLATPLYRSIFSNTPTAHHYIISHPSELATNIS